MPQADHTRRAGASFWSPAQRWRAFLPFPWLVGMGAAVLAGACNALTGLSSIELGDDHASGAAGAATAGGQGPTGAGGAGTAGATASGGNSTTTVAGGAGGSGGSTAPPSSPTCSSTASTGHYCGGDHVANADSSALYQCNGPGPATVVAVCSQGCVVAPAGSDDYCASALCAGGAPALAPTTCSGSTSSQLSPSGFYATSWFGCYRKPDGSIYKDPNDNCEFACGNQGLCSSSLSGPECEAELKWFAADADRFGCGGRIRATNCDNGRSVVLAALDRGPNCAAVEQACGAATLDMSHPAMEYLFEGSYFGACDQQPVVVEEVDSSTQLGPSA
jgi:hypothetical protein